MNYSDEFCVNVTKSKLKSFKLSQWQVKINEMMKHHFTPTVIALTISNKCKASNDIKTFSNIVYCNETTICLLLSYVLKERNRIASACIRQHVFLSSTISLK